MAAQKHAHHALTLGQKLEIIDAFESDRYTKSGSWDDTWGSEKQPNKDSARQSGVAGWLWKFTIRASKKKIMASRPWRAEVPGAVAEESDCQLRFS